MEMSQATRRFTAALLLTFGPLFVVAGFLFAFTLEGGLFIFLGLGMLTSGALLRAGVPPLAAFAGGALVLAVLLLTMVRELAAEGDEERSAMAILSAVLLYGSWILAVVLIIVAAGIVERGRTRLAGVLGLGALALILVGMCGTGAGGLGP